MTTYLSHWHHQYTLKSLKGEKLFKCLSYDEAFRRKHLPLGAYVFTDIDRLSSWELELAAIAYGLLKQAGARVLNDPARVRTRYSLLKTLHREGVNAFGVYRPSLGEWPERYPVFVRRNDFHTGVLSELIEDEKTLRKVLEEVTRDGVPDANVMVVEYAAKPIAEGLFRKHAVYRVGDCYFSDLSVHERHWVTKYGEEGVAGEALYQEELDNMHQVPFLASIQRVFELANIEYGRVDFGVVDGCPQFYEINTNPTVGFRQLIHPYKQRIQSQQIFKESYRAAVHALDELGPKGHVRLKHPFLNRQRKRSRWRSWSHPSV